MKIEVCKGQVGLALYVDDTRVAGPRHNGLMETVLSADVAAPSGQATLEGVDTLLAKVDAIKELVTAAFKDKRLARSNLNAAAHRLDDLRSALLSPPARAEPVDEQFLTAYVSRDCKIVGIDHQTDAAWDDIRQAHIVLRDWLNERLEHQDLCPAAPREGR